MGLCNYIIVTGAGTGIGAATARALADQGHNIVAHYHTSVEGAAATAATCTAAGVDAVAIQADVSTEAGVDTLFRQSDLAFGDEGQLIGLVNNAGVVHPVGKFDDLSTAQMTETMMTNVVGPMICSREAIKRMARPYGGQGGLIVMVGSSAARLGSPNEFIDYAASKGALDTLTVGLAKELGSSSIRVCCVRPGLIDTGIHRHANRSQQTVNQLARTVPLRRKGTADEVADTITWLFSDKASYLTGSIIDVAGGR